MVRGCKRWSLSTGGEGHWQVNPKGIPAQSPRLRGTSYLGETSSGNSPTPTGLWLLRAQPRRNPVGVGSLFCGGPRVARSSQPWAGGHNPFGMARRHPSGCGSRQGFKLRAALMLKRQQTAARAFGIRAHAPVHSQITSQRQNAFHHTTIRTLCQSSSTSEFCSSAATISGTCRSNKALRSRVRILPVRTSNSFHGFPCSRCEW